MSDFIAKLKELNNTPDETGSFLDEDIKANKVMGILAYLSWLVLIPLFAAKNSPYARYHCNQGIVVAIAEVASGLVAGLLSKIPLIGWIFSVVGSVISFASLVLAVIGIINVVNGRAKQLPIVGGFKIIE